LVGKDHEVGILRGTKIRTTEHARNARTRRKHRTGKREEIQGLKFKIPQLNIDKDKIKIKTRVCKGFQMSEGTMLVAAEEPQGEKR
jgi:hypothetical protein